MCGNTYAPAQNAGQGAAKFITRGLESGSKIGSVFWARFRAHTYIILLAGLRNGARYPGSFLVPLFSAVSGFRKQAMANQRWRNFCESRAPAGNKILRARVDERLACLGPGGNKKRFCQQGAPARATVVFEESRAPSASSFDSRRGMKGASFLYITRRRI